MPHIHAIALGLVILGFTPSSIIGVAQERPTTPPPQSGADVPPSSDGATKYEKFVATKGVLVLRTFYDAPMFKLGPLYQMQVQGVVVAQPGETEKAFAVTFDRKPSVDSRHAERAVLDFDEATSLLEAISAMKNIARDMRANSSAPYTEVAFSTRAGFQIGFYQMKNEQQAYVSLSRLSKESTVFGSIGLLDEVESVVADIVRTLRSAGAH